MITNEGPLDYFGWQTARNAILNLQLFIISLQITLH
jgi:hypothetical protein